jgi:dUTP pyrophosphatase
MKAMSEENMKALGKNISLARRKRGVSQIDLAKQAAVSQVHLSCIEHGKTGVALYIVMKIAEALGCSLDELVYGSENGHQKESTRFEPVKGAPIDTKIPVRGTKSAAGYDFYAPHDIVVPAHGLSKLVHFNIKAIMPQDMFLFLRIRSGLAVKHGLMVHCSGIIDADYANNLDNDGNIGAMFVNSSDEEYVIKKGERCMQGIFLYYNTTSNDNASGKRGGGYGSSGKF